MSDKVSLSMASQSNPHQFRMRTVIEEDSFREDKEKLRYLPEQLDEMLSGVIDDLAKKPADQFRVGPNWGLVKIDAEPPLYIYYSFDGDCVRLHLIKEGQ